MARIQADQPLVPSVLDRLLDDNPSLTRETMKTRTQMLRELKQSVRRDLEYLLNTRWCCQGWPDDLDQLDLSLLNYGVPDIASADLRSAHGRERFRQILERVIRHFEPRFQHVTVKVLENADRLDRVLRFRIDAMMYAEPAPEPVEFDSSLEPTTGTVTVKGMGR